MMFMTMPEGCHRVIAADTRRMCLPISSWPPGVALASWPLASRIQMLKEWVGH
jgi:hypothetical protein